ncbi:MAG: hypothetical protein RR955_00665 [Raoultibacter sp.]
MGLSEGLSAGTFWFARCAEIEFQLISAALIIGTLDLNGIDSPAQSFVAVDAEHFHARIVHVFFRGSTVIAFEFDNPSRRVLPGGRNVVGEIGGHCGDPFKVAVIGRFLEQYNRVIRMVVEGF